jgi:hypothetical protein
MRVGSLNAEDNSWHVQYIILAVVPWLTHLKVCDPYMEEEEESQKRQRNILREASTYSLPRAC